jgi:3-dehydrosphinganine reductase
MDQFNRKLVLITGGSSGIGLALARQLVAHGANVYILARRLEHLTSTILELKKSRIFRDQKIGLVSADVSREKSTIRILDGFISKVGVPDFIFNSAGIVFPGQVENIPLDEFHSLMDTNFFGTVLVTKTFLPDLLKRGSGHIVNISSFAGFYASYGYAAYSSTKFAVRGFSDVIRAELKPRGINVSVVFPADVDTPQLAYERSVQPEIMKEINASAGMLPSEKVAESILKGVAKGHYIITPGFEPTLAYILSVTVGWALFPLMDSMIKSAQKKVSGRQTRS